MRATCGWPPSPVRSAAAACVIDAVISRSASALTRASVPDSALHASISGGTARTRAPASIAASAATASASS